VANFLRGRSAESLTFKTFLVRFKNDKRGIGWVLGVAVLSILFLPIIYFPLNYAWDQLYGVITDGYTFTGVTAQAVTVVQLVISYLMAFSIFFTINWAIVQAKSQRYNP
jgi:hypothetical protein